MSAIADTISLGQRETILFLDREGEPCAKVSAYFYRDRETGSLWCEEFRSSIELTASEEADAREKLYDVARTF